MSIENVRVFEYRPTPTRRVRISMSPGFSREYDETLIQQLPPGSRMFEMHPFDWVLSLREGWTLAGSFTDPASGELVGLMMDLDQADGSSPNGDEP
jgi:hypothetical protein